MFNLFGKPKVAVDNTECHAANKSAAETLLSEIEALFAASADRTPPVHIGTMQPRSARAARNRH